MRRAARFRAAEKLAWKLSSACAGLLLSALCGCSRSGSWSGSWGGSWSDLFPPRPLTVSNVEAIDRALQHCSLTAGEQPFHLLLDIEPPQDVGDSPVNRILATDFHAQIELFWLNPITYRTVIRSRYFSQSRIVNGRIVEEHDSGDFYPLWLQNFVDSLLDPIPSLDQLRKVPGSVPIGRQEHACVSAYPAQLCFQDTEPRIATASDPARSLWFEDYAPFAHQQIARTLVENLPGNLLVRAHVLILAPLDRSDYPSLKAREFTLPGKLLQTSFVSQTTADSLLQLAAPDYANQPHPLPSGRGKLKPSSQPHALPAAVQSNPATVLIRTDRTGKVREAYSESAPGTPADDNAVARALTLRFKPLIVNGTPHQMEAILELP